MEYKNHKSIIAFILTATMFTISVCAADIVSSSASASSTSASASIYTKFEEDLLARARMTSHTDMVNDTDSGMKKGASASVNSSGLYGTPTSSYATAWVGDQEVEFDSWSK